MHQVMLVLLCNDVHAHSSMFMRELYILRSYVCWPHSIRACLEMQPSTQLQLQAVIVTPS
jgi:hypothetical protein